MGPFQLYANIGTSAHKRDAVGHGFKKSSSLVIVDRGDYVLENCTVSCFPAFAGLCVWILGIVVAL